MIFRKALVLIFALCLCEAARAQKVLVFQTTIELPETAREVPSLTLGAFGGFAKNFHHTEANVFCCVECGVFGDGKGNGFGSGLSVELPLTGWGLGLTLGTGLSERGGAFGETVTGGLPVQDPNSGKYVPLMRKHSYTASMKYVGTELGLRFLPFTSFPLYIGGAFSFMAPLGSSTSYHQEEQILSPEGVLYPETNTTIKLVGSGIIKDVHSMFAAVASAGYQVSIGHDFSLSPEVRYSYPLAETVDQFKWKIASLDAGLSLRWDIISRAEPPPPVPTPQPEPPKIAEVKTPPPPEPPVVHAATVRAAQIEIVQTIVTETFPILPYVFFDSASAALSSRYVALGSNDRANFKENILPQNKIDAYYNLLNVAGSRLLSNPSATLVLRSTTDGREAPTKQEAKLLAQARAAAIADYLRANWGIEETRIKTQVIESPTYPSTTDIEEGLEENRRVELTSDDPKLLGPIVYERFREYATTPSAIPISLAASSTKGIASWKLRATSRGNTVLDVSQPGTPPASFDWKLANKEAQAITQAANGNHPAIEDKDWRDSVIYNFEAVSKEGASATQRFAVPVSTRINPFELSRLSLVVFDFDNADINKDNYRKIVEFVRRSILPSSTLTITGSTDSIGEQKHNQELSERRAYAVRDLIVQQHPLANITSTKGIGSSNPKYDMSTPEGRYYNRTVSVEVETPLEDVLKNQ